MSLNNSIFTTSHDERARQRYVIALKKQANGPLEDGVRAAWKHRVAPSGSDAASHTLASAREALADDPLFRLWSSAVFHSQSLMWEAVEDMVDHAAEDVGKRYENLPPESERCGSLELDPALEIPEPIRSTEIHRQPRGFADSCGDADLAAGMRTLGASMIYSTGKGQGNDAAKRRSAFLTSQVRERFPELAPKRVLEMGCGCGAATWWTAKAYPDADLHAVDVGPAGLRLGHLLAEESGTPVHFRQADARTTGYPDGHFDLIISYILFHETSAEVLPGIFRECKRLLAPGGAMLHVDVGMQYDVMPLSDQVMNDWQTRYNGEPFWTGYGTTDFRQEIIDAGFSPEGVFAELVGPGTGPGTSQVFGAVA